MISDLGKYIYYTVSSRKSSDSFFLLTLKGSIYRYYQGAVVLNHSIKFVFQKHHQKKKLNGVFLNIVKGDPFCLAFIQIKSYDYYELNGTFPLESNKLGQRGGGSTGSKRRDHLFFEQFFQKMNLSY